MNEVNKIAVLRIPRAPIKRATRCLPSNMAQSSSWMLFCENYQSMKDTPVPSPSRRESRVGLNTDDCEMRSSWRRSEMADAISLASGEIEQNLERRNKLGRHGLPSVMRNGGRDCLGGQNRGRRVVTGATVRIV